MHPSATSFVLGYHGCDRKVAERVLEGKQPIKPSDNDYDWLGDGIYFWEHNAQRAYECAAELRDRPRHKSQKVKTPAVVGAIIDLGLCPNLLDSRSIEKHSGFAEKNHIQLCVRNLACIKGYFRPLSDTGQPLSFV